MPWAKDSTRRAELPKDWHRRRAIAKRDAGGRCQALLDDGTRCPEPGTDADHAGSRDDHATLQWLCRPHHNVKTQSEAAAARANVRSNARHPAEQHPGLRRR